MDYVNEEKESEIDVNIEYARQGIYQIKSKLQNVSKDDDDDVQDDRQWRLSHLKRRFNTPELGRLFDFFAHKLNRSFFALLMMVQAAIFATHFVVISLSTRDDLTRNVVDLSLYAFMCVLSLILLYLSDGRKNDLTPKALIVFNFIVFTSLVVVNVAVPIYYYFSEDLGKISPAYSTHIIIACYVFFSFRKLYVAVGLGILSTTIHLLVVTFFTYKDVRTNVLFRRILSDFIYLLCINGLGIYYRYMDEIIKRRSFLDRRAIVLNKQNLSFQKTQEEQLMSAIIPSYVLDNVKERFLEYWNKMENMNGEGLRDLVFKADETQTYENVTILYADVVNYTEMTVKLNIEDLLETLNDLFGAFDDQSVAHKVLRIKFLGDCYYCVSGLPPDPPENHAEACVDLGLKMIEIIADVRRKRNVNINMRIGIHTGNIISGIIGYQKMHFDIWSKDVILANQMETEGQAGKVHITQTTKDLLRKRYNMEETDKGETVSSFKKRGLKTYLISPEKTEEIESTDGVKADRRITFMLGLIGQNEEESTYVQNTLDRRNTRGRNTVQRMMSEERISEDGRRLAPIKNNIQQYKEAMKETYEEMQKAIGSLCLTKYQQWFEFKQINPLTLLFANSKYEVGFMKTRDPLFKYYLVAELILVVFLFFIQNLTLDKWNWKSWWIYLTTSVILFVFLPMTWLNDLCPSSDQKQSKRSRISEVITNSILARLVIYLLICALFTVCVFSEMIHCIAHFDHNGEKIEQRNLLRMLAKGPEKNGEICTLPWHMTQTCAMAIIMSFLFLRIFTWVKFVYAIVVASVYSYAVWNFTDDIFGTGGETYNPHVSTKASHILTVVFLTLTLHIIDRQSEYMNRLDFLWNQNVREEQEAVESRYIVNKMLLINVLPEHLAEMYLDVRRPPAALYHEKYKNVAVMFATVTGFESSDIDDKLLLGKMSEIIGDFDKLLLKSCIDGYPIEKIKVAKWTYMAASGVSPGFGEDASGNGTLYIGALLNFATAMMRQLMTKPHLEGIGLRVGISNGSIVAGVVGKKKPLYDIWGDPVNMASRMDTTGETNKIHVLEKTAEIIRSMNYKCHLKGITKVKGLPEPVPTFYVDLDENFNLITDDNIILNQLFS